ncbi:hypothetical protein N7456_003298 [Penicillium angulare]|uniref:Uncharacterized protein n=1 Tax=Penicillium angulare TaxID=116970 RepID=A0A9W9FUH7_9EURO|nr:hypothetical protein N7456_003298 [Penicillium angulare]
MTLTSFTPFSAWLLITNTIIWSLGALGETTAVNTTQENETGFIGWYLGPSTTQAMTDPLTWTTSGSYARGCSATGPCAYATDCVGNSITYDNGETSSCNICRTMTIFQSEPYATPSASNLFCAEAWVAFTVFRELPASKTSSESSSSTSSAISRTTTLSTAAATATPSSTDTPATTEKPHSSSKAWIAGAVVGPVVGVAPIAALGWFLYRQKQKKLQLLESPPIMSESSGPFDQPAVSNSTPHEMDAGYHQPVHELEPYSYK